MISKPIILMHPVVQLLILPCPWCGNRCQYVEVDDICPIRVGSMCDEHTIAFNDDSLNDAFGNDYGRGDWCLSLWCAIFVYNERVIAGATTNQLLVW